jgi:hypothetical protein
MLLTKYAMNLFAAGPIPQTFEIQLRKGSFRDRS